MPNIWQTPISSIPESKPDCYLGWGGGVAADSGYTGLDKREELRNKRKLRYLIAEKPSKPKQIKNKHE
ncbi:ISxac1 transposase [Xanthomonas citri pv. glycines str. 8ra]|uniref:Transposase n=1 Tax=Xanthomonas campestris pv. glycines TaxID=473421 RepID=A0AAX0HWH8_XANCG|nr:hypothetical protein A9D66_22000 [Xanthomonas citri pv. glycines str. 12-2]EWC49584.1 ISxac1 transposase [Xanthomonas citri pv. glycines str. 8ra]OEY88963.1 hypothetical protein BIY41_21160 [Xanthomonas citri pv. glycines]